MQETTEFKTTAELRKFIMQTMLDVRYGHCDVAVAEAVFDGAAQLNHSLSLEIKTFKLMAEQGQGKQKLGALPMTLEEK